jgi:hypothetical protein
MLADRDSRVAARALLSRSRPSLLPADSASEIQIFLVDLSESQIYIKSIKEGESLGIN